MDTPEPSDSQEPSQPTGKWLNRSVAGMGLASLFSDLGHEAATAILPLFLISIGAPAAALGIIEGVADALSSVAKLLAGWFSDRVGRRKPIAVAGYALTGLTTGLFALATAWPFVLAIRALGWFGRGIRGPVRDAMLSESVAPQARGRAFGFHRAGDTVGAIGGPLFGLLLIRFLGGQEGTQTVYRQIFWITIIPGLLAALSFALMVRERFRSAGRTGGLFQSIGGLPGSFKWYLVGVGVFGAGDFAHSLLTLRAAEMLTPQLGAAQAGEVAIILYLVHNVVYATMSFPIGALADRIDKRLLLALGYGVAALMGIGWMVAPPSVGVLALLFGLGGLFIAAQDTLEGALAADLLPGGVRGTGYGVLASVNGVGDFVSSTVVGTLWTAVSPTAGFVYATVLFLVGTAAIYRLRGD
jgi:MFS family permease